MDHWHLASLNWLDQLPAPLLDKLHDTSTTLEFSDQTTIFSPTPEPHNVFMLQKGLTRILKLSDKGGEVTLGLVEPGEVFGELAVVTGAGRDNHAVAIGDCTVLKFPRMVFTEIMQKSPTFSFTVTQQMGEHLKQAESLVEELVFKSARSRLAGILLKLSMDFPLRQLPYDQHLAIDLKLTHQDLATLIAASRPTTSIAIGEFEQQSWIVQTPDHFIIMDPDALTCVANETIK